MLKKHYAVYIIGDFGGPFKIGYSKNPSKRIVPIKTVFPGAAFVKQDFIIWYQKWVNEKKLAQSIEAKAHNLLDKFRVPKRTDGRGNKLEWFQCNLMQAIIAIEGQPESDQ